jgi:NTP pyrophosphatase (non-canonical NTP hydrolase)
MATYNTLREANLVRQVEWAAGKTTHTYASNELAGEVSELIDAADDWSWNPCDLRFEALLDEIGDGVICIDLVALRFNIVLPSIHSHIYPSVSAEERHDYLRSTLISLAISAGKACNVVKKLEREELGMPGSRATVGDLEIHLEETLTNISIIAALAGIDADDAATRKFNKTSEKVGLKTRMVQ